MCIIFCEGLLAHLYISVFIWVCLLCQGRVRIAVSIKVGLGCCPVLLKMTGGFILIFVVGVFVGSNKLDLTKKYSVGNVCWLIVYTCIYSLGVRVSGW